MAQASRVYGKYDTGVSRLADSCLKAAIKRMAMGCKKSGGACTTRTSLNAAFEPKITTGAYGDRDVKDEWIMGRGRIVARYAR